jgi:hypothetical protein
MLFFFTALVDFLGLSISLWLAAYLLARGFPSRITLRAAVVMLSLAAFFISAYINIHHVRAGSAAWRAAFLTLGLTVWYDVTYRILPLRAQNNTRWVMWGVYALGLFTFGRLIVLQDVFVDEPEAALWVTRVRTGASYLTFGIFQAFVMAATLYNFWLGAQVGAGPHNRFFLIATSVTAVSIVGYGIFALTGRILIPRIIQDSLLLTAVALFGYSVARHQAFVERHTTLHDFPVSGLAIVGLSSLYAALTQQRGAPADEVAFITVLAILTHSAYDLAREFLDRLLHRHEGKLRRQLRRLAHDVSGESNLPASLQQGLTGLCRTLNASGGFVAVRRQNEFVVTASVHSLSLDSAVEPPMVMGDDLRQPPIGSIGDQPSAPLAEKVAWLAPVFAGNDQVAVVGLGPRPARSDYSESDLDLLIETADWVGKMIDADARQEVGRKQLIALAAEVQSREVKLQAGAEDLIAAFEHQLDAQFVRLVEEGLKRLTDYTTLGQLPLTAQLQIQGETHIERGKALRAQLIRAIETLRPAEQRPSGILPREWHGYAILHDAYIDDVPNREIMARLYISESTFNRQRRKALQAVARALLEMKLGVAAEQFAYSA